MDYAFFFPGQGSQSLGMMNGFNDVAIVRQTFEEASDTLNINLWQMINSDDATAINETINTQPIMLAAGVAVYRAFLEAGGIAPEAMAGHSLGEYSALVAAESLSFIDAVKLVRLRAELMQAAVPQGQGAMAAILGLDDETVQTVCQEAAEGEIVEAANYNSPGQIVIAGQTAAVERAMALAKEKGAKRALPLPVSVPSHCSLMKPAAEQLANALTSIEIRTPRLPVFHNADVAAYEDSNQIKDALIRQLYSPVRWTETVNTLVSDGLTHSAECGPGKVLAGLAKRINPQAICSPLATMEQILAFIEQQA